MTRYLKHTLRYLLLALITLLILIISIPLP